MHLVFVVKGTIMWIVWEVVMSYSDGNGLGQSDSESHSLMSSRTQ